MPDNAACRRSNPGYFLRQNGRTVGMCFFSLPLNIWKTQFRMCFVQWFVSCKTNRVLQTLEMIMVLWWTARFRTAGRRKSRVFTKNWVTQNGGHETHGKGKSEQMQPENSQLTLPRRHNTGPTSLHIMVSTYHKFTYILKLKQWVRATLNHSCRQLYLYIAHRHRVWTQL